MFLWKQWKAILCCCNFYRQIPDLKKLLKLPKIAFWQQKKETLKRWCDEGCKGFSQYDHGDKDDDYSHDDDIHDGKVVRERQVQRSVLMETITATTGTRLLKSDPVNHLVWFDSKLVKSLKIEQLIFSFPVLISQTLTWFHVSKPNWRCCGHDFVKR